MEFWTHASRRPELRRRVAEQHERLLDTVGGLVAGWATRWGIEFRLPAREVVRGIYAISRGMGLEALLADEPDSTEQFEEMFLAYAMGVTRARNRHGCARGGEAPMTRSTTTSTTTATPRPPRPRPTVCGPWRASSSPGTGGRATSCSPTRVSGCGC